MSTSVCYEKTNQDCPDDEFYDIIRSQCVADGTGINVPQGMSNGHCYSKESLKTWLSRKPQNEDLFGGKFNDADKKLIYDAHKFSTDYIEQLVNAGNHDQAAQLFDQTLQYACDFSLYEIEELVKLGLREQAVQLFGKTLIAVGTTYDDENGIERLAKLGLREQAVQLFDKTLHYPSNFAVSEIEKLATLGLREQAVQLFDQTLQYAGDFNVSDIENLTKLGLWEQAVQLWVDTGETLAEILDSRYALDIYKLKQIGILGRYSRIGYT